MRYCRRSGSSPAPAPGPNRGLPRPSASPAAVLLERPEEDHRSRRAVLGGDDRKRGGLDPVLLPARRPDAEARVGGSAVAERLGDAQLVDLDRVVIIVEGAKGAGPLDGVHAARLLEGDPQQ